MRHVPFVGPLSMLVFALLLSLPLGNVPPVMSRNFCTSSGRLLVAFLGLWIWCPYILKSQGNDRWSLNHDESSPICVLWSQKQIFPHRRTFGEQIFQEQNKTNKKHHQKNNQPTNIMSMFSSINVCIRVESLINICYLPWFTERNSLYFYSFGALGGVCACVSCFGFVCFVFLNNLISCQSWKHKTFLLQGSAAFYVIRI